MTQEIPFTIDKITPYFVAFVIANTICFLGLTWYRMKKNGVKFPPKSSVKIKFEENTASGRSHKSFISKLGGARNCLNVVITDQELWINTFFPFNFIAVYYDGIHKIPLSNIQNVTQSGRSVLVDFQRPNGEEGRFELILKNPDKFVTKIQESS